MDMGHTEVVTTGHAMEMAPAAQLDTGIPGASLPMEGSAPAIDMTAPDTRGNTAQVPQTETPGHGRLAVAAATEMGSNGPVRNEPTHEGEAASLSGEGDVEPPAPDTGGGGVDGPIVPPKGPGGDLSPYGEGEDNGDSGEPGDGESPEPGEPVEPVERAETDEPRLPLGIANELFEGGSSEIGGILRNPATIEEHRLSAVYSMAALAEIEHAAIEEGKRNIAAGAESATYVGAESPDQSTEYNAADYQASSIPVPPSDITADYIEGLDPDTGEMEYVVKIQPPLEEPDLDDANLTLAQAMELQAKYDAELAARPEIIWESVRAHQVKILRGAGEDATETQIQNLPIDQVVEVTRFLRTTAIRAAMARQNVPVLEALLPQDPHIPSPGERKP